MSDKNKKTNKFNIKNRSEMPGTEMVFKGVRYEVYQWKQKLFDGTEAIFELVKRNNTVVVIPVIGNEVVIVKEKQPHWNKPAFTLVAGMVNVGEDQEIAARRELEEETGLIFEDYELVHTEAGSPGIEWFVYTYIARGYKGETTKKLDAGEKNDVVKVSVDELLRMTRAKEFFYRPLYIEEMIIRDKVEELRMVLVCCQN